jgi:hypothetical protein
MWAKKVPNVFLQLKSNPTRYFGVSRFRKIDPDVLAEREEFKNKMKEYRSWNRKEYERIQAEVDHKYHNPASEELTEMAKYMLDVRKRDLDRERTSIIKIAKHTKNQIDHLKSRAIRQAEIDKWKAIQDMQKLRERQMYLQAIQIDHSPPAPPPAILDYGLYYQRLQNIAFLSVHGRYEEVEKALKNQEVVDEKNVYLKPIYRNLRK